jgi:hypothetical protein
MNILNRTITLEGILAPLNKALTSLDALEVQNTSKAVENNEKVISLEKEIGEINSATKALNEETVKAKAVKAKIQALITV